MTTEREQYLISDAYTRGFRAGHDLGRTQAVEQLEELRDDCKRKGWPNMVRGLNRGISHLKSRIS